MSKLKAVSIEPVGEGVYVSAQGAPKESRVWLPIPGTVVYQWIAKAIAEENE